MPTARRSEPSTPMPLVTTTDRSFRPVDTAVGPDGAVYVADWCDIRMDHTDPRDTWDKSCGRIWRLRAKSCRAGGSVQSRAAQQRGSHRAARRHEKVVPRAGATAARRTRDRSLVPRLRRLARDERGQLALEALWTATPDRGNGSTQWALDSSITPTRPCALWALRLLSRRGIDRRRHRREAGARWLAPSRMPRSGASWRTPPARLEPAGARAVLEELIRRPDDIADKHIPLRIWWTLEARSPRDADAVLNWLEEADLWQAPVFIGTLPRRIARRLAAERGDALSFTRLDPDGDWKEYARHPRSPHAEAQGELHGLGDEHTCDRGDSDEQERRPTRAAARRRQAGSRWAHRRQRSAAGSHSLRSHASRDERGREAISDLTARPAIRPTAAAWTGSPRHCAARSGCSETKTR